MWDMLISFVNYVAGNVLIMNQKIMDVQKHTYSNATFTCGGVIAVKLNGSFVDVVALQ